MHITTTFTTVDVIKTRYLSDANGLYKTPLSCIIATYKEAGIIGFFKVSWTDPFIYESLALGLSAA